jgi:hypothetical protein
MTIAIFSVPGLTVGFVITRSGGIDLTIHHSPPFAFSLAANRSRPIVCISLSAFHIGLMIALL